MPTNDLLYPITFDSFDLLYCSKTSLHFLFCLFFTFLLCYCLDSNVSRLLLRTELLVPVALLLDYKADNRSTGVCSYVVYIRHTPFVRLHTPKS
jgi:hypothetical protein